MKAEQAEEESYGLKLALILHIIPREDKVVTNRNFSKLDNLFSAE